MKNRTTYKRNELEGLYNVFVGEKYIISHKQETIARNFCNTLNRQEVVHISVQDRLFPEKVFYFKSKNRDNVIAFMDNIRNHAYFYNPKIANTHVNAFCVDSSFWRIPDYFKA